VNGLQSSLGQEGRADVSLQLGRMRCKMLLKRHRAMHRRCRAPPSPSSSLQGGLLQPWLGKSLALGFIVLPSLMFGMAPHAFLIRGTPQIANSLCPFPKKGDGE